MGATLETTTGFLPLLATAIMTAGFAAPFAYVLIRAGRSGPAGFAFLLIVVGVFAFACGVLLNGLSPLLMFGFSWPCVCVGLAYKIDQASAAPQRREPIRPATVSYRPNRVVYHGRPSPRRCADCGSVETKTHTGIWWCRECMG